MCRRRRPLREKTLPLACTIIEEIIKLNILGLTICVAANEGSTDFVKEKHALLIYGTSPTLENADGR